MLKNKKVVLIVWFVIVVASLLIGLKSGTYSYHSSGGKVVNPDSDLYGQSYPEHDNIYKGWFGVTFYEDSQGWEMGGWTRTNQSYPANVVLVVVIYGVLIAAPFVCFKAIETKNKNDQLHPKKIKSNTKNVVNSVDEVKKYKELFDSGAITQEEFETKKKELLNL